MPMPNAYLSGRLRSFGHALRGLRVLLQTQHNARIHAVATVLVLIASAVFGISAAEWALVILAIAGVWVAEALNTALEFLVDLASPESDPLAGKAKDVAAGAVLVAAVGAAIIGGFVFGPHILAFLGR
jgi:diacylglycerol kinase (ATP)